MFRQLRYVPLIIIGAISITMVRRAAFGQKRKDEAGRQTAALESGWQQAIVKSIQELDSALIAGDTVMLDKLLYFNVRFKHSNGMVETKQDLLRNIQRGYLRYTKIEQHGPARIQAWAGKKGAAWKDHTVNREIHVTGALNGKPFDVQLTTTEYWIWGNSKRWILSGRASVPSGKQTE